MKPADLAQASMLDLFRTEAEGQVQTLTKGLLALEHDPVSPQHLEACMRAAHSLKGAARIVGISSGVQLAHGMEDAFVAAQTGRVPLTRERVDALLDGVDLLQQIARTDQGEMSRWDVERSGEIEVYLDRLGGEPERRDPLIPVKSTEDARVASDPSVAIASGALDVHARVLRVTPENLNRLLGLAGESLVESRRLRPFAESLLRMKRLHHGLRKSLDQVREAVAAGGGGVGRGVFDSRLSNGGAADDPVQGALADARRKTEECQHFLAQRLEEIEAFERRATALSHGLYEGALACRMRPFADAVSAHPRMVRDLARSLGKDVRLEVTGESTEVDRDILEKLDAPLGHLLRNAVDHGIESPEERRAASKPAHGTIRLSARHNAGRLHITVSDDGRGIDTERVREVVAARKLAGREVAANLSEAELLEFLLLPGFTMAEEVTDISGRGVGLDVVHDVARQVHGTVRISSKQGAGTTCELVLPLTLSVVRALLVEVSGEPYAVPLASIARTLKLAPSGIEHLEGRQHFLHGGKRIGLVTAHQVLGSAAPALTGAEELCVVVLGDQGGLYGLVVDRFLGERELVVQPLDVRLGKVKDIAAGGLMEDGSPVLIFDVEDVIRSVEKLSAAGRLSRVSAQRAASAAGGARKRVLVIDDSLTVRELERKLLVNGGYDVEVAVDGMDGWNAIRAGSFDLIITDIDMPRLDGIELVQRLRKEPKLRSLPIMIVSYKDRPEDRKRGLDAGADYYLAKGSFHDETLLTAVGELIGAAAA